LAEIVAESVLEVDEVSEVELVADDDTASCGFGAPHGEVPIGFENICITLL
jgi:hypothetical protein